MKTTTPPLHSYRRRFTAARDALIRHITEFWPNGYPRETHTEALLCIKNCTAHPLEYDIEEELDEVSPFVLTVQDHTLIRAFHRAAIRLHRAELRTVRRRLQTSRA